MRFRYNSNIPSLEIQITTHYTSKPISHFSPEKQTYKQTKKKELERAYSKITKGGHSVSRDSTEKYVTNGECTVLDSAIFSLSLSLSLSLSNFSLNLKLFWLMRVSERHTHRNRKAAFLVDLCFSRANWSLASLCKTGHSDFHICPSC